MHQDTLYVTWGDTRSGFLNIWFEKLALNSGNSTGLINLSHTEIPMLEIYPNPATAFVKLNTKDLQIKSIRVFAENGALAKTIYHNNFSVEDLPKGTYFIVTETEEGKFTNKLIKN
jgi:hypothetical protein